GHKLESGANKPETTNLAVASRPETVSSNSAVADEGPTNVTAASEQLNRGTKLLEQGDLDGAIVQYEQAVKLNPDDEDAHYNLGHALARQRKVEEALPYFKEAIRLDPKYAEAHLNLGSAYLVRRKIDEAITELQTALQLKPDLEPARRALAKAEAMRDT